ncbi:MAG: fused DSP-PTPase phosphatase/NAD kinase-like protein [Planctomycetota bacterium]|jgi:protein tyrosine phosphatase (PTP) superfamily phosphohydrolase (DUF442 family)
MQRSRRPLVIGLVAAAIGGGAVFWHKVLEEEFFPKNFGVVEEGEIYRSGQLTERMFSKVVADKGIKTVIALNGGDEVSADEAAWSKAMGVERHVFDLIGDGTGDPNGYAAVVQLMADPANQPVLVHCAAGAQRTATSVLLYHHLVEGVPLTESYPEMFDYGHKPKEWVMLAYLVDNMDVIEAAYAARQAESDRGDEASGEDDGRPAPAAGDADSPDA